jgi:surfeit locus 1 family protein
MIADIDRPARPARPVLVATLLLIAAALFVGLLALGGWQIQRLGWKQALISRVEQQLKEPPVAAPGPLGWSAINRSADEYRRVQVSGHFDHSRETLVRASTVLGSGFWVLTPLKTTAGFWLIINRGFIPPEQRENQAARLATGLQTIGGLLRLSEPGGTLLQSNDSAAGRWYSRDVVAIASSTGLGQAGMSPVAPYFVDAALVFGPLAAAQASEAPVKADAPTWPRAGLTVLNFHNSHLVYALTWFVLAAMVAGAAAYLVWSERLLRRRPQAAADGSDDAKGE